MCWSRRSRGFVLTRPRFCFGVVLGGILMTASAAFADVSSGTVMLPAPPVIQSAPKSVPPSPAAQPLAGKIIVIDPGHAVLNEAGDLVNPGARAPRRGVWERDVALSVAEDLVPLLEAQGAKVIRTRTRANPWRVGLGQHSDNRARAIFANVMHADAYVRLHCDWNRSRKFKGYTTFYFHWMSRPLAMDIRKAFLTEFPTMHDNGIHRRTFVSVTAEMPTVLVEMGVLTYKEEGKALATPAFQQKLAQALSDGISDYFKSKS